MWEFAIGKGERVHESDLCTFNQVHPFITVKGPSSDEFACAWPQSEDYFA